MTRILVYSIVALMSATGLAAQSAASTPSPDVKAVLALDSVWARNYAVHDTTTALRLMADDFFMTGGNGSVKDKAAEMRDIRPTAGLRMEYFRNEDVRARVYEGAAVVTGIASWAFEMNGRTSSTRRRYTAVYAKGGPLGWRLVALHMGGQLQ